MNPNWHQEEDDQDSAVSDSESFCENGTGYQPLFRSTDLARVGPGERVYGLIERRFKDGLGETGAKISVMGIHRRVWESSWSGQAKVRAFRIYARAMAEMNGGREENSNANVNEKFGWFGTTKEGVERIVEYGFGETEVAQKDGKFGRGVYLSPVHSPLQSVRSALVDEDGLRHVLLCRVLLGKMEMVPFGSQQSNPSSGEFDSGVDDALHPKKYIVWSTKMNTHILPEYVITFNAPDADSLRGSPPRCRIEERMKLPRSPWMAFPELISVLSRSLPPEKITVIKKFHKDFKEKRIQRHELIQKLRQLLGDDLLIQVIKSYRTGGAKAKDQKLN